MKIKLVKGMDLAESADLLDEMFKARKRLFSDRLGWDVTVDEKGWEVDQYDPKNPLYLISTDENGEHLGSLRLLPTTGDTMLRDVFASLCDGTVIESPLIWECTRFCIESDKSGERISAGLHQATTALLLGICETGLRAGIQQIVGVFDRRMIPIYRRGGWPPEVIGQSGTGRDAVYLGVWDVTEAFAASIRKAGGLKGSILEPESRRRAAQLLNAA
jgi:acyl homoserine lactone synthase